MTEEHGGGAALSRVARGGAATMAGALCGTASNPEVMAALAHAFPRETVGVFFSATSVFLIVPAVADPGASSGLVYFIARLRAPGAGERARVRPADPPTTRALLLQVMVKSL